jgi:hypoxanthine phosphoribosyltransferase
VKTASLERFYSAQQLAARVALMGREISRDYADRTVDVVVMLESAFVFGADLIRRIDGKTVCHFVRIEISDVQFGGHERREIYFGRQPRLGDRDVLVVDALIESGLTQEFLLRRLQESRPRTLRLAVLFDKPAARRVDIKPDYFCFSVASKYLAGYGLAGSRGWYRNLPYVGVQRGRVSGRAQGRSGSPKSQSARKA